MSQQAPIIIIGGGIGGLTLALALHQKNIPFKVYEAAEVIKPLGVGLNLLPHAMRDLAALGLEEALRSKGIETKEYVFYTANGQRVFDEPRGLNAGYPVPQMSIHRGDLHMALLKAVRERAGDDSVIAGHRCVKVDQNEYEAIVYFADSASGEPLEPVRGQLAIACDGVHSVARAQFHPNEAVPRYEGTTQYRGTTVWPSFLSGASMVYMGTYETGKLIIYPIRDNVDGKGNQLINWVIEVSRPQEHLLRRDWNKQAQLEEFIHHFEHCNFDWLDVPAVMRAAETVLEYPMVDQEPLPWWTKGRITLLGDAAHPMMPRGSNGAAQAIIDATTLARLLAEMSDRKAALKVYEAERLKATSDVVLANRGIAPDAILRVVQERTEGKPFERIDDVIDRKEMQEWQDRYRKVAGFAIADFNRKSA